MRILKIMLMTLVFCVVSALLIGCGSESDLVAVTEDQIVTVQRGDLTIDITASGNLVFSHKEELAFEVGGTVEEILVEEGESVEEGQVLAKLDTSEWEDNLAALEDKLTAAERQLTVKERQVTTAERQLETKKRNVAAKELDLRQAEMNLKNAERALANAQDALTQEPLKWIATEEGQWTLNREEVEKKELELEVAKMQLEDAEKAIEDAQIAVEDAQIAIEDAQIAVEDTQKDIEDAQDALDEALNTSLEITAPFDGFVTKVNIDGGDEVLKGTVAVQLADPSKFEADILVSEMDIFQVKLGGEAWVQVDAMQMLNLPAKVTHISPTATIQAGVVNYKVKVEIESLQSVMQERQEERQEATQGELPERLRQAIEEGRITQEQVEEMMKQRQQGQEGERGMPTMLPEDFQLREGLTVTVSIIVDERNDVLLVPNRAIIRQGTETYVQVLEDGTIKSRSIKTGISNWQYTEVTDGLGEGEQVVVPQGTTTTPTSQQSPPGGIMRIPGMRPH